MRLEREKSWEKSLGGNGWESFVRFGKSAGNEGRLPEWLTPADIREFALFSRGLGSDHGFNFPRSPSRILGNGRIRNQGGMKGSTIKSLSLAVPPSMLNLRIFSQGIPLS